MTDDELDRLVEAERRADDFEDRLENELLRPLIDYGISELQRKGIRAGECGPTANQPVSSGDNLEVAAVSDAAATSGPHKLLQKAERRGMELLLEVIDAECENLPDMRDRIHQKAAGLLGHLGKS